HREVRGVDARRRILRRRDAPRLGADRRFRDRRSEDSEDLARGTALARQESARGGLLRARLDRVACDRPGSRDAGAVVTGATARLGWASGFSVVLAIVGVLGTWRTAGAVSLDGLEGAHDGWLVIIFAVVALAGVRS